MIKRNELWMGLAWACLLAVSAQGAYTLRVNGVDVGDGLILEMGQTLTIGVYSDSLTPVATEPTAASEYIQDGCWIIGWDLPSYSHERATFTNMVTHPERAGADVTGWTNLEPPDEDSVVNIGWVLESTPAPISTGIWWECTFTPNSPGAVKIGLGTYSPGYAVWTEFDAVNITIIPAMPPAATELIAQWDGDHTAVINGNQVTHLYDQTANAYHMDQGWEEPNNYRPLLVSDALNGHDVLQFDGAQFMEYNPVDPCDENWLDAGNYTWFVVLNEAYHNPVPAYQESIFSVYYEDTDTSKAGNQYGWWGNRSYAAYYGGSEYHNLYSHAPSLNGHNFGFSEEYLSTWSGVSPGWKVLTGVWDEPNQVTVENDVDMYCDYTKGITYFADQDKNSTGAVLGHRGCFLGMADRYAAGTPYAYYFKGQIAEVRVYRGAMTPAQVRDETQSLRIKYGLEDAPCTDMADLIQLAENWLDGKDLLDFAELAQWWNPPCD